MRADMKSGLYVLNPMMLVQQVYAFDGLYTYIDRRLMVLHAGRRFVVWRLEGVLKASTGGFEAQYPTKRSSYGQELVKGCYRRRY